MRNRWVLGAGLLLIGIGGLLILWSSLGGGPTLPDQAEVGPEPIVPTRTPIPADETEAETETETETESPAVTDVPQEVEPSPTATDPPASEEAMDSWSYEGVPRWGIGVALGPISAYDTEPLRLGWYLNWAAEADPQGPPGVEHARMVRLKGGALRPNAEEIARLAELEPGALWLISNEPDVRWQDNVEPEVYARLYHEAYGAIKGADPGAQVAIGGVTQPTPLRLRYLDEVLNAYEELFGAQVPVDLWHVHNFILREERDGWGVDIPPGLPDEQGVLYEIDDGDDMDLFAQQILDFRRWMAERGYQDKALIVSEYGILMPEEYGFPPERVLAFLTASFDFFLTATDPEVGYPADDYRLVQRFCWYSLDAADDYYPTGRLFDPQTGAMTAMGEGWATYVAERSR